MVAPRGMTKPATSRLTCNCCSAQRNVKGKVAALELVEKAVISASMAVQPSREKVSCLIPLQQTASALTAGSNLG